MGAGRLPRPGHDLGLTEHGTELVDEARLQIVITTANLEPLRRPLESAL